MKLKLLLKMTSRKYLSVSPGMCFKSILSSIYLFSIMSVNKAAVIVVKHEILIILSLDPTMNQNLMEK